MCVCGCVCVCACLLCDCPVQDMSKLSTYLYTWVPGMLCIDPVQIPMFNCSAPSADDSSCDDGTTGIFSCACAPVLVKEFIDVCM